MQESAIQSIPIVIESEPRDSDLRAALKEHRSRELVFAVVGYAGSGTTFVATQIRKLLEKKLGDSGFHVCLLKATELLDEFAAVMKFKAPQPASKLARTEYYQTVGDQMRLNAHEHGAVSAYVVRSIRNRRVPESEGKNIFVLDSLKHPAEVDLLRSVYGDAFCLIGVGCRPDVRSGRLARKYGLDEGAPELERFIERDAEDSEHEYGQQVNRTFHLADYFVDNTHESTNRREYVLPDQIKRLFDILFTTTIKRPRSLRGRNRDLR